MITSQTFTMPLIAAQNSPVVETLLGFLPLALFLLVLFYVFRRQARSPVAQLQREYLKQQMEIMPRIDVLLERIAKALERDQPQ